MPLNDKITHPSDICLMIMCALPELVKKKPKIYFIIVLFFIE